MGAAVSGKWYKSNYNAQTLLEDMWLDKGIPEDSKNWRTTTTTTNCYTQKNKFKFYKYELENTTN